MTTQSQSFPPLPFSPRRPLAASFFIAGLVLGVVVGGTPFATAIALATPRRCAWA
jgi:hypothetical protein